MPLRSPLEDAPERSQSPGRVSGVRRPADLGVMMNWNYACPRCRSWLSVPWRSRLDIFECPSCTARHQPPTPGAFPTGFVDTHNWPEEVERVVVFLRGNRCTVPGCLSFADTLDHRVPWSRGGRTSVSNLHPICEFHNRSKADADYPTWLANRAAMLALGLPC